ncbi:hypothetical protein TNCV_4226261 [Trichonephila clavipes]|uniref:Uncharacterized protein n=1 Tax=Trichonephila clavipes TaxID=2585209 RepID=A0A8X6SSN2_TRICX|nr:hypothetical protein TNCV_4226261 [Trichonephila clavipes]
MKNSLDGRHIRSLHAGGRHPRIGSDQGCPTGGLPVGRRTVLLARWIVRSVPLEIVGSNEHEEVPTRGKPGLERPGRPRGETIEGSCGKHLWTPQ